MAEKSSELDYTDDVETQLARRDFDEDDDLLEIRSEEEALETTAETDDAGQIRGVGEADACGGGSHR